MDPFIVHELPAGSQLARQVLLRFPQGHGAELIYAWRRNEYAPWFVGSYRKVQDPRLRSTLQSGYVLAPKTVDELKQELEVIVGRLVECERAAWTSAVARGQGFTEAAAELEVHCADSLPPYTLSALVAAKMAGLYEEEDWPLRLSWREAADRGVDEGVAGRLREFDRFYRREGDSCCLFFYAGGYLETLRAESVHPGDLFGWLLGQDNADWRLLTRLRAPRSRGDAVWNCEYLPGRRREEVQAPLIEGALRTMAHVFGRQLFVVQTTAGGTWGGRLLTAQGLLDLVADQPWGPAVLAPLPVPPAAGEVS